ncbi:Putative coagulation factor 5/8 domain, six-hairpin glycosidase superfamily [Septoria linicola]|uniref:Coagulation factor 5/8 domain, six-hairpin glycosidase superfamily n=1 Tax=Septoria linicola TaxID=215465 RepID=A0A9Q9EP94_9PEZI|nr:Putative coagulation factor 5/8 domain, six-hairpin glycosidase superfamily [Septoria linicola]
MPRGVGILAVSLAASTSLAALDTAALAKQYYGNDAAWYQNKIPYFEVSDSHIQEVYYYRWRIFRAHQRDLGQRGYVSTEFLDDVGWQLEPWATLNDATGFHLGEGRWLRDRRYADDYINHMYEGGGNDRHFTDYMADSVWQRYLVDGDRASITSHLNAMTNLFNQWNDALDTSKGLYWREPLADATEYTISSIDASGGQDGFGGGEAFRPTINSYMWANALAIANVADLAGQGNVAADYRSRAASIKSRFQADIWNTTLEHFIDRHQRTNQFVQYYQPIRGRELAGYVPWMFGMPDNTDKYNQAWKHLKDTNKFRGSNGMRTNEPSYQYYMRQYRYLGSQRECQWNGPVWPYQTTQVLLGMANLLNSYTQSIISKADYLYELRSYTRMHYWNNKLNLEEDYEPDKAGPIVGLERSPHYFHSGYNDLIISGLVGIRPRADNTLEVNPMVPAGSLQYFRLQDVIYHGRNIAVQWDANGSRYGQGAGLRVEVDGQVVATSSSLSRVTAQISGANAPAINRSQIAKSIQLRRGQNPSGSASSGQDSERIHDAIDGRVWFMPELANGWDSDATSGSSQQWYAIDFGTATSLTGCELAFYDDGNTFAVPADYDIQRWDGSNWVKIQGNGAFGDKALANGITKVSWPSLSTSRLRAFFPQAAGKRTRLVEFKAY